MQKLFLILLILGFTLSFSLSAQAQCCKPKGTAMATVANAKSVKQEKTEKLKLKVTGMTCAGCASHVHKLLSQTPGVVGNTVEYPGDIAVIEFNPDKTTPQSIMETIEKNTSYTVEVVKDKAQKKS